MAQTCPQNMLSLQNQSSVRHNVPQACDETFCSRGTEIRQLIGSRIRCSYPLIIRDYHLIIIPCAPFESLGSNANKYGCFKSRYLQKIHPKNLHISRIKAILRDVFLKYLQARY